MTGNHWKLEGLFNFGHFNNQQNNSFGILYSFAGLYISIVLIFQQDFSISFKNQQKYQIPLTKKQLLNIEYRINKKILNLFSKLDVVDLD